MWELAEDVSHAIYRIGERSPAGRHEAVIERLPVGICRLRVGSETEVLEANPAFLDTFGIESEAALGDLDLADLLGETAGQRPLRDRLEDESLIQEVEQRGQTVGGEEVRLSVTALQSEGEGESYYDCMVRETTEENWRECDLSLFREAVEASGHSIYFTDVEGTIEYVNPTFEEVTGYSAAEAIGRTPRILKSGEQDQDYYRELWETILAGDVWRSELWNSGQSGETYAINQTIAPVEGPSRDPEHFVVVNSDVTDRKERERELQRYESIVQASGDAVYMLDPRGRFTFVNDALTRITGYEASELLGEDVSMLMAESDIETGEALIRDLLSSDSERATFELTIHTAEGEEIPMENHIATIETEDGRLEASVGIVRDLSDRKAREQALERQNERLEEFAAVVSHDLRNPLNVAMSRLELMEETGDTADHVGAVNRSLSRMEALIDDLLALTREGSAVEETVPVYLANAVEGCWRNVETEEATLRAGTDLLLRADASRLKQLLENLFRNAIEHGGEDVTVRVGDLEDGFFLSDDGRGIAADQRERVFESGFTTASAGTGLGLNIVQEIAEARDWDVAVTESNGGGARFEVTDVDVVE
ncbi:MAG: PAS domain S-box protein [Haloarculaceae archaeon]